jgi:predicted metal-dependent phosphoesterase TrpH
MLVDFHMHTTCSDGVWPPQRLFDEIRDRGLEAFCVSDHDNINAYPMPPNIAERSIPGLEVDSHHGGHTAHLLAYGVSDNRSPLLLALGHQRNARLERMDRMVLRCNELGLDVTMKDVRAHAKGAESLGRPHLARALVDRGHVESVQEAFDMYLADEGEGYIPLDRLTAAQAIELIHLSGGVAVIAHPKRLRAPEHLFELIDAGADGVEIVHPTAQAADEAAYSSIARERGLLVTGGSDFHAPVPGRQIGIDLAADDVRLLRDAIARRAIYK